MLKRIWNKLSPWRSQYHYLVSTMCIIGGIVMLTSFFTKPSIHSEEDLVTVNGYYSKHSFTYTSGRGGGCHYVVQLDNYRNPFKIKADFIDDKIKEKFENTIKKGEQLTLQIPRSNKDDLNSNDLNFIYSMKSSQHEYLSSNDPIFIYSMKSPQHEYLSSNDTINAHNSKRMLYVGFGFFLAGILYSVFRKRYLASKTTAQKNAES